MIKSTLNKLRKHLLKHKKKYGLVLLLCFVAYYYCLPKDLFKDKSLSTVLFDYKGQLLGAKIATDGQWRFPSRDSVPHKFKEAILCFEDRRFYEHSGVDPWAILRAIYLNVKQGRKVSGGSTLTMQVIRLSRENPPRTIWEKSKEAILATRIEWSYSKEEILNMYASHAPFGGNVVGIDAAAWKYFNRPANQLSWAESTMLAVLPNSPGLIHLSKNRDKLLTKRNRLLDDLRAQGILDSITTELAKIEPIPDKPLPLPRLAPHLLEYLHQQRGNTQLQSPIFESTLRLAAQRKVNEIINQHVDDLRKNQINNAAALVVEVKTGDVLAYVGNAKGLAKKHSPSVNLIHAQRSTGSILKPFLYATMLSEGKILEHTLFPDIPAHFGSYTPSNFDKSFMGAVASSEVISRSLNIPSVFMLKSHGVHRFLHQLQKIGLQSIDKSAEHYGLSLILGGAETNLWDLVRAYSGMARTLLNFTHLDGAYDKTAYRQPNLLLKESTKGKISKDNIVGSAPLSAGAIWSCFKAMQELIRPGEDVFWKNYSSSKKIAWKTGTSFGFRDAWAVGCTPQYVIAVWAGNADGEGRPGLIGVKAAAPILFDILEALDNSNTWFEQPYDDQQLIKVCQHSGHIASPLCTDVRETWEHSLARQTSICPYHKKIHLNASKTYQVNSECASTMDMQHENYFILPAAQAWYYKKRNPRYRELPKYHPNCSARTGSKGRLALLYPQDNLKIYVPNKLDGTRSKTVFHAAHSNHAAKIYWHLDNEYIGETEAFHYLELDPKIGQHLLTITDEEGESLSRTFEILEKDS